MILFHFSKKQKGYLKMISKPFQPLFMAITIFHVEQIK